MWNMVFCWWKKWRHVRELSDDFSIVLCWRKVKLDKRLFLDSVKWIIIFLRYLQHSECKETMYCHYHMPHLWMNFESKAKNWLLRTPFNGTTGVLKCIVSGWNRPNKFTSTTKVIIKILLKIHKVPNLNQKIINKNCQAS